MRNFTLRIFLSFFTLLFLAVKVYAQAPVASFTSSTISGCAPLVVSFTSTSTGNPTSYSWNLGNSVTSTIANPSTTYPNPGTYTITLTVTNGNGSNTITQTNYITVYASPTVNFTGTPLSTCPGSTVNFTNSSIANAPGTPTYQWNFGNGNSATTFNASETYYTPGTYSIALQVTNSQGCSATELKNNYIVVNTPPTADFSAATTSFCAAPATVNFTALNGGTGYTYAWDFGDGTNGTGATPAHNYTTSGNFNVTLITTDNNGCKDTIVKPSYVFVNGINPGFTNPGSACVGQVVTFNNTTTPGPANVFWKFGDGGTSTLLNGSHAYAVAGTYTVTMIATVNGCQDSSVQSITINPNPSASFQFSPHDPCPAPAPIQFTNTSTGATTYQWSFGDGGSSTATNPNHVYANNGIYTAKLVAISNFGCKDSVEKIDSVRIHDLDLIINATPIKGCAPLNVNFSGYAVTSILGPLYPYNIATYSWVFGDGGTSSQATPSHVYTNVGVYWAKLTITTQNGCSITDSVEIRVGTMPTAAFSASKTTLCYSDTVSFTNNSTGATTYLWEFGDGLSSTNFEPVHQYAMPGTFTVILYADFNGCYDTAMITDYITVLPSKSIIGVVDYSCDTAYKVNFKDASIGATSWLWIFGDGATATTKDASHVYATTGTYNVNLVTVNDTTGCTDTTSVAINLFDTNVDIVSSDSEVCRDETVTFTAINLTNTNPAYSGWKIFSSFWQTQYPNIPYEQYVQTFNQTGYYTIKYRYRDDHGCWDSVVKTNYQLVSRPVANFGADSVLSCVPLPVQFTDTSIFVSGTYSTDRAWDFGDGTSLTIGNDSTPSHTYTTGGLFDVRLIVTDNIGCADTLIRTGYIDARDPKADFLTGDSSVCIGDLVSFANLSTGVNLSYEWNLGNGFNTVNPSPTTTYNAVGGYTVWLAVQDDIGCKDTLVKTNYITLTKPTAGFTMNDTFAICPPLVVQFTNTSVGASNYSWDFDNGSLSTLTNPSNVYNNGGIYDIVMIASDPEGCKDTAYGNVTVLGYNGALTYGPSIGCAPLNVNFTSLLSNVPVLVWDFADGVTTAVGASGTTSHTYTNPGAYVPRLILGDGAGCVTYSYGLDTIKVDAVTADFNYVDPACIKSPVQINDNSSSMFFPNIAWSWKFHDGVSAYGQSVGHTYDTVGSYDVQLITFNTIGCRDTITKTVTTIPLPVISAGLDTVICVGDAATLMPSGGVSYTWSPAATLSCTNCTSPQATPTKAQEYVVEGLGTNGCYNQDTVLVKLKTKTVSSTTGDKEMCAGIGVMIEVKGAQIYDWTPSGSLDNSTSPTPIANPETTTIYTIIAREGSCIPDTHRVKVIVHPLPIVDAGYDLEIVAGERVELHASGNAANYIWTNDGTLTCSECPKPWAQPSVTTEYTVTGYTGFGCIDSDKVIVHVLCDQGQVFIPNTFTPNGDGHNDYFYPRGKGIDKINYIRIYNRWGELVYEATNFDLNDKSLGWDGTFKGRLLEPDAFVYMIEATCITGEPMKFKGDVTLLR